MIRQAIHLGVDFALISGVLAGVRRSTGIGFDLEKIESKDVRYYTSKYLDVGESMLDYGAAYLASSQYFKRSK